MKRNKLIILSIIFVVAFKYSTKAQESNFSEQVIGSSIFNFNDPLLTLAGIRYIPDYKSSTNLKDNLLFKTNFSLNIFGNALLYDLDSADTDFKIKPYRLQFGFGGNQFDVRLGLQKINFGSASLLRPLMWFDRIDPRDPLQLTEGVYSVLGRYYFLNNANIWIWGLLGNKDTKGWENFSSNEKKPEFGGRIQYPLLKGELALTYHYREGVIDGTFTDTLTNRDGFSENRYAIDGKFDFEIGLWFEGALIHQNLDFTDQPYQRLINVGADYTFGLGNGLNIITEYFTYQKTEDILGKGDGIEFGAMSLSYPINIINNLQAIVFYDFTNNDFYRFVNFSWTYDNWMIYVSAFWNPDNYQIYQNISGTNIYGGYGAQIMLVFNH